MAAFAAAGIWPLIVAASGSSGHEASTAITIAAGGLGATVFPYFAGLTAEVLPGNFIPILASPLFVVVLVLTLNLPADPRQHPGNGALTGGDRGP